VFMRGPHSVLLSASTSKVSRTHPAVELGGSALGGLLAS
jgi:hypothetical protein